MADSISRDPEEQLKGLRITSLDDDGNEEEEEETAIEEEEEEEEEMDYVTLGFVKRPKNSHSLLSRYFPTKSGGCPAWMNPVNLPSGKSFLCDICEDPLQFMLQVYAPDCDSANAFHRTLFVFICTSLICLRRDQHEQWKRSPEKPHRSVKVFRCQLPQNNPFYASVASQIDDKPHTPGVELCTWCGTWEGIIQCPSCSKAPYCSEKHRVKHSREGHDYDCQRARASDSSSSSLNDKKAMPVVPKKALCPTIWPEFEIIQENEIEFDEQRDDNGDLNSSVSKSRNDDAIMSIMKAFEADDEKKSWATFEDRISWAPEQVLRYCRDYDSKPLWPMSSGRPSKADIPPCKHCGGPLGFEFQILPQLLYYFRVTNDKDSLDWSTIAVYTCENSCDAGVAYKEEFAWVQLG